MKRFKGMHGGGCRITAALLCLCMLVSLVTGADLPSGAYAQGPVNAGAAGGPTENIVANSRIADPDTTDSYQEALLSAEPGSDGSRYAGRIWTDKSVFAYGEKNGTFDGTKIKLDENTDGIESTVGVDADFLHVYSALASSQKVNEYPQTPIDLVITFDMSASMGQDTRYELDTGVNHYKPHLQQSSYMTFQSIDKTGGGKVSQAQFSLKHGQGMVAINLPDGATYTVSQTLLTGEGQTDSAFGNYTVTASGNANGKWDADEKKYTGTVSNDSVTTSIVSFVDQKNSGDSNTGNLTVTNAEIRAISEYDEFGKEWNYTVTVGDAWIDRVKGQTFGDMTFDGNGKAEFTLKHGESKTAVGLPVGLTYTVEETPQAGFTTTKQGDTGAIAGNNTAVASFVNVPSDNKAEYGVDVQNILIINTAVTDVNSDKEKNWRFTIQLDEGHSDFETGSWIEKASDGIHYVDGFPAAGVPMAERIANSRIQQTLKAINQTIDSLMKQNPQNRVAVCAYGANATVLMPLAHWKGEDKDGDGTADYLTVGGMETLYHPSDLKVVVNEEGKNEWRWMNNRDTCYTVEVDAKKNTTTTADFNTELNDDTEWEVYKRVVSNNIDSDTVKAYPGTSVQSENRMALTAALYKKANNAMFDRETVENYNAGKPELKKAMNGTHRLAADEYIGYFTNTQGGIYLAYKQLAQDKATTYTDKLTYNNKEVTVARIPAAIIMSDGGANFAMNPLGTVTGASNNNRLDPLDNQYVNYFSYDEWKEAFGELKLKEDKSGYEYEDDHIGFTNLDRYYRLSQPKGNDNDKVGNLGDEWYNVWLPGKDTFTDVSDENPFNGLPSMFNTGADVNAEGTLSSQPRWLHRGVLYSSDNDVTGLSGTTLEVLLTASFMSKVVKEHYRNGWNSHDVSTQPDKVLNTYTMNVDTAHVPLWGRMRIYPSLDPKGYPLDNLSEWYTDSTKFGTDETIQKALDSGYNEQVKEGIKKDVLFKEATSMESLSQSWEKIKNSQEATAVMQIAQNNGHPVAIKIKPIPEDFIYNIKYDDDGTEEEIPITNQDVIDNIAYNDGFYDIDSDALVDAFKGILTEITGQVFAPVSGSNASGASDSITYQDPIGDYMELKNQAITVMPNSSEEGSSTSATYDMSLLLFGKMHGLVRTGIYDFQWNDAWMKAHEGEQAGEGEFPKGWYKGSATDATTVGSGENGGPDGYSYANAEAAWADGWVYRLGYKDLLDYVPISDADVNTTPQELPTQIKSTTYTVYRFADSEDEREMLRMNPVYGEKVPDDLQKQWDAAGEDEKRDNSIYRDTPGVYRLSDIRVWGEEYGDYVDTEGAITPNSSVYDASLYVNIPTAAVPTQLAEITLGPDGVLSYKTNLDEKAQSTPVRLFYAVGLDEDLIIRDAAGNQTGVDISALPEEYVSTHRNADNSIWFISNYYSNTTYGGYAESEGNYTRGDPTVSFSPSKDNRYYVFQKPRPIYAHAYRVQNVDTGDLAPIDAAGQSADYWNKTESGISRNQTGGNGTITDGQKWETSDGQPSTWAGGLFMGVYENEEGFKSALAKAKGSADGKIIDSAGEKFEVVEGGLVFFTSDLLEHVTTDADGKYTGDSVSFNSEDYFFILLDYYIPDSGKGVDLQGNEIDGTSKAHAVQRVVTRRGSEFGSGLQSNKITNGDMLCWTDTNGIFDEPLRYNSRTETGDNTRGEPTYEKLYKKGEELVRYLLKCGFDLRTVLDEAANWTDVQNEYADVLAAADSDDDKTVSKDEFEGYFHFAVAARPGGLRTGDMFQNRRLKTDPSDPDTPGSGNKTQTSYSYYVPTISSDSGVGDDAIIDNYLGNNGRLAVSNRSVLVTKTLTPLPAEGKLNAGQKGKEFNFQVYMQGMTGERPATRVLYDPYSETWRRRIESIDVLTNNSGLLFDKNNQLALFDIGENVGQDENGNDAYKARLVVKKDDGYYYANEVGESTGEKCEKQLNELYYVYLPGNTVAEQNEDQYVRRIYMDPEAEGYALLQTSEVTTYYPAGSMAPPGGFGKYAQATEDRPAGTHEYWVSDAELISVQEVENADGSWTHTQAGTKLNHFTLLINKPVEQGTDTHTSENDFVSAFSTRTVNMTQTLNFGKNANEDGSGNPGEDLTQEHLYFTGYPEEEANTIAASTAEFTLKSGEGLLFTGLQEGVPYYFAEQLSEADQAAGYGLDRIEHVTAGTDTLKGTNTVTGSVGTTENQAHFYNTVTLGDISITKELLPGNSGEINEQDKEVEFKFRLELTEPNPNPNPNPDGEDAETPPAPATPATLTGVYDYQITDEKGEIVKSGHLVKRKEGEHQSHENDIELVYTASFDTNEPVPTTVPAHWPFTLKAGQTMSVFGLPLQAGYRYTLTEISEGYTVQYKTNDGEPVDGTVAEGTVTPGGSPVQVVFQNTKQATPATVDLVLSKLISGDGFIWDESGIFTFLVQPGSGNPAGDPLKGQTRTVTVSGTNQSVNIFQDDEFTSPGLYTYTITEKTSNIPGISTDGRVYTVIVEVRDASQYEGGYKGELKATVTVEVNENGVTSPPTSPAGSGTLTFNNTFEPGQIQVPIQARKVFLGGQMEARKFQFELTGVSAEYTDPGQTQSGEVTQGLFGQEGTVITPPVPETQPDDGDAQNPADPNVPDAPKDPNDGSAEPSEPSEPDEPTEPTEPVDPGLPAPLQPGHALPLTAGTETIAETVGDAGADAFTPLEPDDADEPAPVPPEDETLQPDTPDGDETPPDTDVEAPEPPSGLEEPEADDTETPDPGSPETPEGENPPMPTPPPVPAPDANSTVTQWNDANGVVNFGYATFTQAGTYTYTMREIPGDDPNMHYDSRVYTVVIQITGAGTSEDPLRLLSVTYFVDGAPWSPDAVPVFTNILSGLTISKTVTGEQGDTSKEWHFTITLTPPAGETLQESYPYTGGVLPGATGVTAPLDGTLQLTEVQDAAGGGTGTYTGTVTLQHGQTITITGLPPGTSYTVTETEADQDGYTTTVTGSTETNPKAATGTIQDDSAARADFTNHKGDEQTGGLTVSKTVTGADADVNRDWHFTVTLSDTSINGTYGDMTFTDGVTSFTLKHGESKTATGLPQGITYTVTEAEANQDGYTTTPGTPATGTIPAGPTARADFTNHKGDEQTGSLTVSKTVVGADADVNRDWHFTVTLSDTSINGTYGDMTFTNGVASFTLKHGESKTATGLPQGITYTVTEAEANQDGYTTTPGAPATGTVTGSASVSFINDKYTPPPQEYTRTLTVTKTVTGEGGDLQKEWHFTVTLSDTSINGPYGGMTFVNGVAHFTLRHGQSALATGLPPGITYTVTEEEAGQEGYRTEATGDTGTLPEVGAAHAYFTNEKAEEPDKPEEPNEPNEPDVPDEPDIPEKPNPPTTPPTPAPPSGPPKTEDPSRLNIWVTLALLAAMGLVVTTVPLLRKRRAAQGRRTHARNRES